MHACGHDAHMAMLLTSLKILTEINDQLERWFASGFFAKYRELASIVFVFVGIKNEKFGSGAEHHNEKIDIDEDGLKYGVLAEVQFVLDYLDTNKS